MLSCKVAVVTGSNKGIGFAVVRGLCKEFDGDVYVTSRDVMRGEVAVAELKKEGLNPKLHQLDIDSHSSVKRLYDFLKDTYGGLDILVNNAAIAYRSDSEAPLTEQAEVTVRTNFWSTLDVCNTLFPLLRPHARVVNVSTLLCHITFPQLSAGKQAQVLTVKTMDEIKKMMTEFVEDTKGGHHAENGWGQSAYITSKVGVILMSMVQQAELDASGREDIVVNAACPGLVDTDMTRELTAPGKLTIDQGADKLLYLALLPDNVQKPRGTFLSEKKVVEWK